MASEFETSIHIQAPVTKVWDVLLNTSDYKNWNSVITTLSGLKRVGADGIFILNVNKHSAITWPIRYHKIDEYEEFAFTANILHGSVFKITHYFRLENQGEKSTQVVHGERYTGAMGQMVFPMLKSSRSRLYASFNDALKKRCEK